MMCKPVFSRFGNCTRRKYGNISRPQSKLRVTKIRREIKRESTKIELCESTCGRVRQK
jgi:hypothetical protein